jgi:hypothetical protein
VAALTEPRQFGSIDEHMLACAPRYLADLDVGMMELERLGDWRAVASIAKVRARLAARVLNPRPKGWFRRGLTGIRRRREEEKRLTGTGRSELP